MEGLSEEVTIVMSLHDMIQATLLPRKIFSGRWNIIYRGPKIYSCFTGRKQKEGCGGQRKVSEVEGGRLCHEVEMASLCQAL